MESQASTGDSSEPLRILSLDGGGIRGISSLLILEEIMQTIRKVRQLDQVPRPCDYFDLIGGTSTGGIIAIMLGRLGMTVDECIRAYRKVAQQAFTPKRSASFLPAPPKGAFSAQALESAIKQTVREFCPETECVSRRREDRPTTDSCPHTDLAFRDQKCTKTVVFAITKANIDASPTLFETYDTSAAFDGCTIWQVARATSAATTFFKSIQVGRDGIEFIDAGFGYNNPCEELIKAAEQTFPERRNRLVLSIGTGLGNVVDIKDTRLSIIKALKSMATSSQKVAANLDHRYGDSDQYFRFNVDRGLEDITLSDWEQASKIAAHTTIYLAAQSRTIEKFVHVFTRRAVAADRHGVEPTPSDGHQAQGGDGNNLYGHNQFKPVHVLPTIANRHFSGRDNTLALLQQKLFIQKESPKMALYGLGGVGKTQVALQLAYWVKKHLPEYSIFWVPVLSEASFEQAYTEIGRKLTIPKISDDETVVETVRRYLSSVAAGMWLLVVDNADDMDMLFGNADVPGGLYRYFPTSDNGVTFLTTRSREVAVEFAEMHIIELQKMNPKEATGLFKKVVKGDLLRDQVATTQLLEELNWLPLAITQAAAYMNKTDISTSRYLELMHGTEKDRMNLNSCLSLNQKAIPRSILPVLDSEEETEFAIGMLCGYAFVTKRENGNMLDMHDLVQLSTRLWLQKEGNKLQAIQSSTRHMEMVFPSNDYTNRELWRAYLPHALRILRHDETKDMDERYELFGWISRCLLADGRAREAVGYSEEYSRWEESHHDNEEHADRLFSQHQLASAYLKAGQIKQAIVLLKHVVAVEEKILDEKHLDRLASQHALALAYHNDGQIKQAIVLLKHVVVVQEKTLDEKHRGRLASEHELASAYLDDGQIEQAVELLKHAVAVKEKILDEEHPDRLVSQHKLASAYLKDGQIKQAVGLLEHVVAVKEITLDKEHPERLASEHELASAYLDDGQIKQAVELLKHVVAVEEKILDEEDPDRLASQHLLAKAVKA
ncbi:hypothetical protein N7474_010003 [Penicillium riverlandense]|uniref:uncharacterized protein n=1 Tax=Penicillium riverlandense TaxID=1903569 RepID=UPI002547333D|nr:uncharacterized protein N7474_010003 [Penicillium riverlandense]KAJ5808734.1 hypothetical protein N7474_010003 [Penicillium riverlandense]